MFKPALNSAVIFAIIAVIVGAMGAHALHDVLTENQMMDSYETAVKYQIYHSFALLFTGILYFVFTNSWIRRATWFFIIGIILFSGSIYALIYLKTTANIGIGGLGILTPIGGVFFISGWISLLIGINKKKTAE